MIRIKFIILVFSGLLSTQIAAQRTNLVFKSDNEPFTVYLNNIKQTSKSNNYVRIKNFNENTANAKIVFDNTSITSIEEILSVEVGGESQFEIVNNQSEWNLVWARRLEMDAILPIRENQLEVNYIDREGLEHKDYVKIETYAGAKGCEHPLPMGEIQIIYKNLHKLHYADEKYKTAVKSLKNQCVKTEQASKIIEALENEFYKEKFTVFIHEYTYDIDNFNEIIKTLPAESQEKVKSKLGI